jgi:phosphoribosylformylglycinamidine cyclo-ligase
MPTLTAPTYAKDGVNLDAGDSFSSFAANICRESYQNSPYITVTDRSRGLFRGPRTCRLRGLSPDCEFSLEPDGNGTKPIITTAALAHSDSGCDLFAMTGMDSVRYGGKPLVLVNQLDVESLGNPESDSFHFFCVLMHGLGIVAEKQGVVLLKGETAEMGVCVASENPGAVTKYNWCGVMYSVFHEHVFITGEDAAPGHVVIALRDGGLRANGGSSARKAFAKRYGERWWGNIEAHLDIKAAAVPSVLYENLLTHLNGWNNLIDGVPQPLMKIHGIAHITGGGIPSKFFSDFLRPRGLSANLTDLWEPPSIMRKLAEWRGVSGKEAYEIWHGGQGALVVLSVEDAGNFLLRAGVYGIDAKIAGEITKSEKPTLTIKSKFDSSTLVWK